MCAAPGRPRVAPAEAVCQGDRFRGQSSCQASTGVTQDGMRFALANSSIQPVICSALAGLLRHQQPRPGSVRSALRVVLPVADVGAPVGQPLGRPAAAGRRRGPARPCRRGRRAWRANAAFASSMTSARAAAFGRLVGQRQLVDVGHGGRAARLRRPQRTAGRPAGRWAAAARARTARYSTYTHIDTSATTTSASTIRVGVQRPHRRRRRLGAAGLGRRRRRDGQHAHQASRRAATPSSRRAREPAGPRRRRTGTMSL